MLKLKDLVKKITNEMEEAKEAVNEELKDSDDIVEYGNNEYNQGFADGIKQALNIILNERNNEILKTKPSIWSGRLTNRF